MLRATPSAQLDEDDPLVLIVDLLHNTVTDPISGLV
jgi:hypothetical protein